jgi:hypothetical protein
LLFGARTRGKSKTPEKSWRGFSFLEFLKKEEILETKALYISIISHLLEKVNTFLRIWWILPEI